jgi:multisubunit Na+/H+ antiporter MnhG subunit
MEALFVNQLTLTEEVLREFYKEFSALPHRFHRAHKIILPMLGILLILLASFLLALRGDLFVCIVGFILGVAFIFVPPVCVRFILRLGYRQQVFMNGGNEMQKKTEFADQIRVTSSNKAETKFDYAQIKQICETKHLIVLRTAHTVVIFIGKDGFTVGTLEDFRRFIRGKCPSARFVSCK